jgi:hypothetical protein
MGSVHEGNILRIRRLSDKVSGEADAEQVNSGTGEQVKWESRGYEKKLKKIEKPVVSTVDKSELCVIILPRKYNPRGTWVFCCCGVSEGIIRIAFHHPPPKPGSVV